MIMRKKSINVHYSGMVQGVGFRYTVSRLSRGFSVYGSVKNLSDGRVLLSVEGTEAEVDRFLIAIKSSSLSGYIRGVDIEEKPYQGFNSFDIAY